MSRGRIADADGREQTYWSFKIVFSNDEDRTERIWLYCYLAAGLTKKRMAECGCRLEAEQSTAETFLFAI